MKSMPTMNCMKRILYQTFPELNLTFTNVTVHYENIKWNQVDQSK